MNIRIGAVLLAAILIAFAHSSGAQTAPTTWGALDFLLGEWVGEGSSEAGQGSGAASFHLDLQKRVIVRTSHAEYPAAKGKAAYVHDDLMIIYRESEKGPFQAIFFDNEGHVIRYGIQISPDEKSIEFLSETSPGSPTFRLTYTKTGADGLVLKLEMAPPGKPDAFSPVVTGAMRRKK